MDRPLDGYATSPDWQRATTRIAVLPVGACEQHGGRLPLLTDAILAEHFATGLAVALGAARLPVLAYATSAEHAGFRGSLSLRPETAMAVLRDLVDCLEQQGFARLVVVNAHGGNYFLGPVARDLNARDRPIKVLLADYFRCDDSEAGGRLRQGELHAGAWETSLLLAIRPAVVRPAAEADPPAPGLPLEAADLNTFGIGSYDRSGVWGDAGGGDAGAGSAIAERISARLLQHVRTRLAWLERQPAYAGAGGIAIRPLRSDDIDEGMRLCALAGWNQLPDDWRMLLELCPHGSFAAVRQGRLIGTAVALTGAGDRGWIGMVLVDPALRRLGIGTLLMQAAIAALAGARSIGLDATAAGRPVYQRLGFADGIELRRLVRRSAAPPGPAAERAIRPMHDDDLPALAALDAATGGGGGRLELLRRLRQRHPGLAWTAAGPDGPVAGLFGRTGAAFTQLGPLLAPDQATARALVATALAACPGPVGLDVPAHDGWIAWLAGLGFAEERRFRRMFRGPAADVASDRLWAIAGPELG